MISPKKSLGQNFLIDQTIVEKIISSADLKKTDLVLEIGPGLGVLTNQLADKAGRILAVELDRRCVEILEKKFKEKKQITIIEKDILKFNFSQYIIDNFPNNRHYKVVANIPYYITAPIIRTLLTAPIKAERIILMTQKEVAERIVAKPGQLSILGLSVQYFAQAKILFNVPRTAFSPTPAVDSAILEIIPYQEKTNREDEKKFFQLVRAGFSAKRKTLVNNLTNGLHLEKTTIEDILKEVGISSTRRAQELTLEEWKKLSQLFFK